MDNIQQLKEKIAQLEAAARARQDQDKPADDYWQDLPGTYCQATDPQALQTLARLSAPPPLTRVQALMDKTPKFEGVPRAHHAEYHIKPYQDLVGSILAKLSTQMDLAVAHTEGKVSAERYFATSLALTRSAFEDARIHKRSEIAHSQARFLERRSDVDSDGLFSEAERQKIEKPQSHQRGRQAKRSNYNFRGQRKSFSRSRSRSAPRQENNRPQYQSKGGSPGRSRQARSQPPRRGD